MSKLNQGFLEFMTYLNAICHVCTVVIKLDRFFKKATKIYDKKPFCNGHVSTQSSLAFRGSILKKCFGAHGKSL